jgi:hypothetical protein
MYGYKHQITTTSTGGREACRPRRRLLGAIQMLKELEVQKAAMESVGFKLVRSESGSIRDGGRSSYLHILLAKLD